MRVMVRIIASVVLLFVYTMCLGIVGVSAESWLWWLMVGLGVFYGWTIGYTYRR